MKSVETKPLPAVHPAHEAENPTSVLVCIDPGGTTGIAVFEGVLLTRVGVLQNSRTLIDFLATFSGSTTFICEDFNAIRLTESARSTIKLIGMIELLCLQKTEQPPYYQRPQERRSFLPLSKALLGLRNPKGRAWMKHHQDAVAHGLCYLVRHYPTIPVSTYKLSEHIEVDTL